MRHLEDVDRVARRLARFSGARDGAPRYLTPFAERRRAAYFEYVRRLANRKAPECEKELRRARAAAATLTVERKVPVSEADRRAGHSVC